MPRLLLSLLALAGLATAAGCAAERSTASASSARVGLAEILDDAYERRDDGSLALLGRLPAPQRVEAEPVENRHVAGQTDTLRTLHYDGLTLEVYAVAGGREILQEVRVTGDGYETAEGLGVGSTRAAVRGALGEPTRSDGGTLTYDVKTSPDDLTPTTLTVRFDGDRVAALTWSYYVD
jgi:hypothetical protein